MCIPVQDTTVGHDTCGCENCTYKRRFDMNCACGKYCSCRNTTPSPECHRCDTATTVPGTTKMKYYRVEPVCSCMDADPTVAGTKEWDDGCSDDGFSMEPATVQIMYGWQCLVCFNVYAPHVDFCFKCNQ